MNQEIADEKTAIECALRNIFKNTTAGSNIKELRTSSDAHTYVFEIAPTEKYFIKAKRFSSDPAEFLRDRMVSSMMAKLHQVYKVGFPVERDRYTQVWIYNNENSVTDWEKQLAEVGVYSMGILTEQSIIIEIQNFVEGETCQRLLATKNRKKLTPEDRQLIERLCKAFRKIHSVQPKKELACFSSKRSELDYAESLRVVYNKSLKNIYHRIERHVPIDLRHPIINDLEFDRITQFCRILLRKWFDRGDRLSALHGDPRLLNLIIASEDGDVIPIDFSRVMWGARGYDIGRCLMDIYEMWIETKNPFFKEFADTFVSEYASMMQDTELAKECLLGIFSMGLIKLDPAGTPIKNSRVARELYEFMWKIFDTGTVLF